MTFILIFLTAVVSVVCFGNRRWFDSLAMIPYRVAHDRQWYRAVTYGFVHADYMHLIVNMFVLLSFGQYLERLFRAYEHAGTIASGYLAYGLLYFGGLIASVASDMARHRNDPRYVSIGASEPYRPSCSHRFSSIRGAKSTFSAYCPYRASFSERYTSGTNST